MESNKNGSIIIVVLLITVGITVLAVVALKSTLAFYDLALERTEHICQIEATQALALYGIAVSLTASENKNEYHESLAQWPLLKGKYQGNIISIPSDHGYSIKAQLMHNNRLVHAIQCQISIQKDSWHMVEWTIIQENFSG